MERQIKHDSRTGSTLLVVAFAVVSSILYCLALPLWEGFDEPFHYGYIEALASQHQFPVIGRTLLPADVFRSLHLTPLSRLLSGTLPGTVSFEDWFSLSPQDRSQRRQELYNSQNWTSCPASRIENYEAQQAPLAYLLLLPVNLLLSRASLPVRILILRLVASLAAMLLVSFGGRRLARTLGLSVPFEVAAMACVFQAQMVWAAVSHVGNDWLAVPLTFCFLAWLGAAAKETDRRNGLFLAVLLTAGLLTKAYFLAFVPVYLIFGLSRFRKLGVAVFLPLISLPWYLRNWFLYRSISGTQESAAGVGVAQVLRALIHINWLDSFVNFLRWSLWTGNWSFLSFSKATLSLELILLLIAGALYFVRYRQISVAERWQWAAAACFLLGLVYQTCATWVNTRGSANYPEPWYWQGLLLWLWLLFFRGFETSGKTGRICGLLLCLVSAWIAALTYLAKLLPWYGGLHTNANPKSLCEWWFAQPSTSLSEVVLAPLPILYAVLVGFLLLLLALTAKIVREFN